MSDRPPFTAGPAARKVCTVGGGILLALLGAVMLWGWLFQAEALTRPLSGYFLMRPTTALCVAVLGVGLVRRGSGWAAAAAQPIALLAIALALLDLAQATGIAPWSLDAWLFAAFGGNPGSERVLPVLPAATVLALGIALWLLPSSHRRWRQVGNALATGAFTIGLLSSLGYGYAFGQELYKVETLYPILPLPLAVAAMGAGLVLQCASHDSAFARLLTARGEGGRLARWVLPVAILGPVLIGWLRLIGQWGGYYPTEFGVALSTVGNIGVIAVLVYRYSFTLERTDAERRRASRRLVELNAALETRVRERTAQLETAVQNLESFSYSVSHDLRAPLRSIDNFSQFLVEDHADRLDAEGQRLLGVIRRNARRMGELIDDMLAFSRAGTCELVRAPFDPAALVEAVLEDLGVDRERCEVVVGPLPRLQGDRAMLRQVLFNLLANAVKFSAGRERPRIEVAAAVAEGEARITVSDNGVGFDPAYTHKLFRIFERLHSDAEFEGTGVGLAIVRRIVERHGGRVWAEGRPGAGATFGFSLPHDGGIQ